MPEPEASKAATVKEGWTAGGRGQGQPAWTDEDGQEAPPRRPVEDGSLIVELSGAPDRQEEMQGVGAGQAHCCPTLASEPAQECRRCGGPGLPTPTL